MSKHRNSTKIRRSGAHVVKGAESRSVAVQVKHLTANQSPKTTVAKGRDKRLIEDFVRTKRG